MMDSTILEAVYSKELVHKMNNECSCGYPLPMPFDLLIGKRTCICPKCGKDNTPVCYED